MMEWGSSSANSTTNNQQNNNNNNNSAANGTNVPVQGMTSGNTASNGNMASPNESSDGKTL